MLLKCSLYNTDDNTLSFIHQKFDILKQVLEKESLLLIQWFSYNCMTANLDKFQAIYIGNKTHNGMTSFKPDTTVINCEDNVTLLGVSIDFQLSFTEHISEICKKASQQQAVLKRLGIYFTKHGKMTIFKSAIKSNYNYCPAAWHFCAQLVGWLVLGLTAP